MADTATFTCSTGYELVGDSTLTCQSDGTWDSPPPVCQGPSGKSSERIHLLENYFDTHPWLLYIYFTVSFGQTTYTVTEGVDEFLEIVIQGKNIKEIFVVNISLISDSAKGIKH